MKLLRIIEEPARIIARFVETRIQSEAEVVQAAQELSEAAKQAKSRGRFVLDFRNLQSMGSAMCGKLVLLNKYLVENGIHYQIWNVQPGVMEVFRITRLSRVLPFADESFDHAALRFAPKLFEIRNQVLAALEDADFYWWRDYSSVDPLHDVYGIEVRGIPNRDDAVAIQNLLERMFPDWRPGVNLLQRLRP